MKTMLLDNSVLNEILNDVVKTDKLIWHLSGSSHRVVVGMDTVTENFAGNTAYVIKRLPNLKKIIDSLPKEQFVIANTMGTWLTKERKNKGRLKNVPVLYKAQRWPGFLKFLEDEENFIEFHNNLEPMRDEQFNRQADLKKIDKTFRERAQQLPDPDKIKDQLMNFKLHPYNSHLKMFGIPLGISVRLTKKIISSSSDIYKIHRVYLAALYLRSLGNAISCYNEMPDFKFLQKIKEGNWFDLAVIAQASQFNFLVSNDEDQRNICNFLESKSIVKAKAIGLQELFIQISK